MTQVDTGVQAVLWDMDGTLVDTEPYWFRAETELLSAYGIPWSSAQAAASWETRCPPPPRSCVMRVCSSTFVRSSIFFSNP